MEGQIDLKSEIPWNLWNPYQLGLLCKSQKIVGAAELARSTHDPQAIEAPAVDYLVCEIPIRANPQNPISWFICL